VLARANLRLVSWTGRLDTVSGNAARVLGKLTRHLQTATSCCARGPRRAHLAAAR